MMGVYFWVAGVPENQTELYANIPIVGYPLLLSAMLEVEGCILSVVVSVWVE